MDDNDDEKVGVDRDFECSDHLFVFRVRGSPRGDFDDGQERVVNHGEHVEGEEEEEEEEVLVVFVAQTVVHKCAVVVEALDTLVAVVAVHRVLWPQIFAVDTDVVQVELLFDKAFHKSQEIFHKRDVAGVNESQTVEEDRHGKEDRIEDDES